MNADVERYLKQRWPEGLRCPLCQHIPEWASPPDGPHVIEGSPLAGSVAICNDPHSIALTAPVGVFTLICTECGYVALLYDDVVLDTPDPT